MESRFLITETRALPESASSRYVLWAVLLGCAAYCVSVVDYRIANYVRFGDVPGDVRRILNLSEIFAHGFGVFVVLGLVFVFATNIRHFLPRLAVCAFWPGLVVQGVKHLFYRTRPGKLMELPEQAIDSFGQSFWTTGQFNTIYDFQSFPSGHTATAFGLAVGLSWMFPRGKYLFFSLAVLAGLQRIFAGAHWSSDVLMGATLGVLCAGAITQNWGFGWLLGKFENNMTRRLQLAGRIEIAAATESDECEVAVVPSSRARAA